MNRFFVASAMLIAALTLGCDRGGSDTKAGGSAKATADKQKPAVGRCAVDARDSAPYGKITAETVEPSTNELMYRIEGKAATWNKKAANVRVVDCS